MNIKGWYCGWKATIRIHLFDRDTLRELKKPLELRDFGEVPHPGKVTGFGDLDFEHGAKDLRYGSDENF